MADVLVRALGAVVRIGSRMSMAGGVAFWSRFDPTAGAGAARR